MTTRKPRPPLSLESLDGYVAYRADLMGLPNVGEIADAVGMDIPAFNRFSRFQDGTSLLEDHLDLRPGALEDRAQRQEGPSRRFRGMLLDRLHFANRFRSFCPAALARSPHHRDVWNLAPFPFSDETWDYAVHNCLDPLCAAQQKWFRTLGVANCEVCGESLARTDVPRVPRDQREPLRLALGLVHPDPSRRAESSARLPNALARLDPGTQLGLLVALAGLVDPSVRSPLNRRSLRPEAPPELVCAAVARAWTMMTGWPAAFRSFVDVKATQRGRGRVDGNGGATDDFLGLPDLLGTPPGLAKIIRAAREQMAPAVVDGLSSAAMLRQSGIQPKVIVQARLAGRLPLRVVWNGTGVSTVFDRAAADAESRMFAATASVYRVGADIGCGVHGIEQICALGLLEDGGRPYMPLTDTGPRVPIDAVDRLVRRLRARLVPAGEGWTSFGRALLRTGGRAKPYGPIVREMLAGSIPIALGEHPGTFFSQLLVPTSAALEMEKLKFDRSDHPGFPFVDMIPKGDAAVELNLGLSEGVKVLSRFPTNRMRPVVPLEWLNQAMTLGISSAELGALLGTSGIATWHRACQHGLRRIGKHFYDRRQVDEMVEAGLIVPDASGSSIGRAVMTRLPPPSVNARARRYLPRRSKKGWKVSPQKTFGLPGQSSK